MTHCTQQNLIARFSAGELAQLAAKTMRYQGEAASAAALPAAFPGALADDLAFAQTEGEFYRFAGTAWEVNPLDKIAGAISDAAAEIDAYLTGYPLPLAVVPANLTRIACDMARYYLYDDQMIDVVEARYKAAVKYLEQVAAGKIPLAPNQAGAAPLPGDSVAFQAAAPVFGGTALDGF